MLNYSDQPLVEEPVVGFAEGEAVARVIVPFVSQSKKRASVLLVELLSY